MGIIKERMKQDKEIRGLSENTREAYLSCIKQFVKFFMTSLDQLTLEDIHTYQVFLIRDRKVAGNTFNQYVSALKFLYGVTLKQKLNFTHIPFHKRSIKLPVVLSREEVVQLYKAVTYLKHKAMILTLYSTGIRVSELVHLKVADIDGKRMQVRIEPKPIPCCCQSERKVKMKRASYDIVDIFRDNLNKIGKISPEKWKVVNAIISCRTARLGGHVYECDNCGHEIIFYNLPQPSLPEVSGPCTSQWLDNRMKELLPVEYFHVVYTIPNILNRTALCNKEVVYGIFFRAVKETLLEASMNPKNLGARIGFLAILHTWGQNLLDHPHIHCVVLGGGLSPDGSSWISSKKGFLVSVKILAKLFRGKFLDDLKRAFQDHKLHFYGENKELEIPKNFQKLIDQAYAQEWVVYVKKPFSGSKQVLQYLGKYTHRVAISNHRIIDVKDVCFCGRVYETFPTSCYSQKVCENPFLWSFEQPEQEGNVDQMPGTSS